MNAVSILMSHKTEFFGKTPRMYQDLLWTELPWSKSLFIGPFRLCSGFIRVLSNGRENFMGGHLATGGYFGGGDGLIRKIASLF